MINDIESSVDLLYILTVWLVNSNNNKSILFVLVKVTLNYEEHLMRIQFIFICENKLSPAPPPH
jgi:hypothetical protein